MTTWLPVFAILGWIGLFIHNVADLPDQTVLSPESLIPLLVTTALVALWFTPFRRGAAWSLLAWAVLNLAGAVVTVLPLTLLPFDPEQSPRHYAFHLAYGLTQLPLIIAAALWIRRRTRSQGAR